MSLKIIAALGAIVLLTLGTAVADAGSLGGGGGHIGGGGGAHFSGGGGGGGGGHFSAGRMGGGNFAARSFRSGPNFGGRSFRSQNFSQNFGQNFRAPRIASGDRSFRGRSGRIANFNGGRWHGDRHGHHRRGSRFFFAGVPYGYYYDDYAYYGDDCGWLYRRAIQTGSPYWWQRYQVCEG